MRLPFGHAARTRRDLRDLDTALTAMVSALRHESNRTASRIVGVAASKMVAAGVAAGAYGAIGLFGAASTGTAIGTLSGAAATSATYYWIGSSVGLGASAGGMILSGGAIATALIAVSITRRRVFGRPKDALRMSPPEQAALYAALRLAAPIRIARAANLPLVSVEKQLFAREGLAPLVAAIDVLVVPDTSQGTSQCNTHPVSLAWWPRRRLRGARARIGKIADRWGKPQ